MTTNTDLANSELIETAVVKEESHRVELGDDTREIPMALMEKLLSS